MISSTKLAANRTKVTMLMLHMAGGETQAGYNPVLYLVSCISPQIGSTATAMPT